MVTHNNSIYMWWKAQIVIETMNVQLHYKVPSRNVVSILREESEVCCQIVGLLIEVTVCTESTRHGTSLFTWLFLKAALLLQSTFLDQAVLPLVALFRISQMLCCISQILRVTSLISHGHFQRPPVERRKTRTEVYCRNVSCCVPLCINPFIWSSSITSPRWWSQLGSKRHVYMNICTWVFTRVFTCWQYSVPTQLRLECWNSTNSKFGKLKCSVKLGVQFFFSRCHSRSSASTSPCLSSHPSPRPLLQHPHISEVFLSSSFLAAPSVQQFQYLS